VTLLNKLHKIKNGSSVKIREAQVEDAAAMIELALSIFDSSEHTLTTPEEFTITEEKEIKIVESHLKEPGYIYLLAEQNGKLVGMLNFQNGKKRKNSHVGELAMGVAPSYRHLGIGTLLMETLIEWAEKNPAIMKVCLAVFISNGNAIHLYKNMGFMEEGRKRREIKMDDGDYIDLVLMCKFV